MFVVAVVRVVVLLRYPLGDGVIVVALDAVYTQIGRVTGEGRQRLQLRQTVRSQQQIVQRVHRRFRFDLLVLLADRRAQQQLVRTQVADASVQHQFVRVDEVVLDAGVGVLPAGRDE